MVGKPFKRGKRWCVVVEMGRDPVTDKRRQQFVYGSTRKEVEAEQVRLLRERDTGTMIDPTTLTVGQYLDHWLAIAIEGQRAVRTHETYGQVIRNHLSPAFGTVPLAKLLPAHLATLYARLRKEGRAPTTVLAIHAVLHNALKQAVRWQMLPRNVAEVVKPPHSASPAPVLWDEATLARFLERVRGRRLEALYVLTLNTGMRQGELLGLRWMDGDLDGTPPALAVRRQQVATKRSGRLITAPKGKRARPIVLTAATVAALRDHRQRQDAERVAAGSAWQGTDIVFANPTGGAMAPRTLDQDWRLSLQRWGLPHMKFHGLRHLHATYPLLQGVHPKIVSERLGHATTALTMEIYSHVTPTMQAEAALAFDERLAAVLARQAAGPPDGGPS